MNKIIVKLLIEHGYKHDCTLFEAPVYWKCIDAVYYDVFVYDNYLDIYVGETCEMVDYGNPNLMDIIINPYKLFHCTFRPKYYKVVD